MVSHYLLPERVMPARTRNRRKPGDDPMTP
jgi:hypothetical protein